MSERTDVNYDEGGRTSSPRPSRRAIRQAERAAEREAYLTGQQPLLTRRELRRLREEAEALRVAVEAGEITPEQARELQNPLADPPDIDVPVPTTTGQHAAVPAPASRQETARGWTPAAPEARPAPQDPARSTPSWTAPREPSQSYTSPSASSAAVPARPAEPLAAPLERPGPAGFPREPERGAWDEPAAQAPSWQSTPSPLADSTPAPSYTAPTGSPYGQPEPTAVPDPLGPDPLGYGEPAAQQPAGTALPAWQAQAGVPEPDEHPERDSYSQAQKEALAAAETGAFTPGDFAEAEGFARPHSDPSGLGPDGLPVAGVDPSSVVPAQPPARRSVFGARTGEPEASAPVAPAGPAPSVQGGARAWEDPAAAQSGEPVVDEPQGDVAEPMTPSRRPIVRIPSTAQGVRTVDSRTGELTSVQPVDPGVAGYSASSASSAGPVGLAESVSPEGVADPGAPAGYEGGLDQDFAAQESPRWPSLHEESGQAPDLVSQPVEAMTPYGAAAGAVPAGQPAGAGQWQPQDEPDYVDDEEDEEEDSLTIGKMVLIAAIVLVVAALVVVGVWYVLGRSGSSGAIGAGDLVVGHLLT